MKKGGKGREQQEVAEEAASAKKKKQKKQNKKFPILFLFQKCTSRLHVDPSSFCFDCVDRSLLFYCLYYVFMLSCSTSSVNNRFIYSCCSVCFLCAVVVCQ